VSAYILKIEEGTFFYKKKDSLILPDEDETSELYLEAVEALEKAGFAQYEISNFSKEGIESRHNLKYWRCEEYLGIGAAAHSFADGRRFYYERSIADFVDGKPPVDDGEGGGEEEYIMLALRLSEGLIFADYESRFGKSLPESIIKEAGLLEKHGLLTVDGEKIALTKQGFLLSNAVICRLLEKIG
jgi:oxygen-independent coproporphyrinogen-3 oxidase